MNFIKKYFEFEKLDTNFKKEIVGGLITFLAMCYILFVNPIILAPIMPDTKLVFTTTAIIAAVGCILMGLIGKRLLTIAPGMGLNTLFAATIGITYGFNFSELLAICFIASLIHLILSITGFRTKIANGIPECLKLTISIGIGLFIAVVGMFTSGLLVSDPNTTIALGSLKNVKVIITLVGLLILIILQIFGVKKAVIYTLLSSILLSVTLTLLNFNTGIKFSGIVSLPSSIDLSLFIDGFKTLNFERGFKIAAAIFSILFVSIFNVQGNINATEDSLKIEEKDLKKLFLADSLTFLSSSIVGTSPSTMFAETMSGIEYGAKSGFASIICGLCFILSLFFSPLLTVITSQITAPILISIGITMFKETKNIDFSDNITGVCAFITILLMPLTYSIINGIGFGIILYTLLKTITYKKEKKFLEEVPPFLILLSILCLMYFVITII